MSGLCVHTFADSPGTVGVKEKQAAEAAATHMKPSGRRFCYCLPCSASTIYGVVRAPAVGTPQQSLSTRSSIPAMLCNPLAERGNVSELKTQLGAVKEAVQKEQVRSGFGVIAHGSCLCSHWRAF